MKTIKNKIIALSGEPVSGKGTNVKAIYEKLLKNGYTKENIHLIGAGEEFRKYFRIITQFINQLDNPEKLIELSKLEQMQIILENPEYRAKFIEGIHNLKEAGVDCSSFSIENANNNPQLKEIREVVDTIIDTKIRDMGKEINEKERPDEIWIVDSRLAFSNIPEAFSIRLISAPEVAGKRLMEDKLRGKEDANYKSLQEAISEREKRRVGEIERYKERYGIDLSDESNYNMIIDTSYSSVSDISDVILNAVDRYSKGQYIPKKWASPVAFLPTQNIRETWYGFNNIEDVKKNIEENGYDMKSEIDVREVDGVKYLVDGHHRNFASAMLGKTLVPYHVLNGKEAPGDDKAFIRTVKKVYLWDHESLFDNEETGKKFSYDEIYPGIYEKLEQEMSRE